MNENEEFTHVQRRLCAVIAKSEWTSSRMRMQKSGEELRESRAKSHRTANQFLQDLLEKRSDADLIDDNGAVDRYHKFLKFKSPFNDDPNGTLDEFDRRLRALNANRGEQKTNVNNSILNPINEQKSQAINHHLLSPSPIIETPIDKKNIVQQSKASKLLPSITTVPITSTPNDTTSEFSTSVFHDDEIQELSNVQSVNTSFVDSQTNHLNQAHSQSLEKSETLNSSTTSLNQSFTQPLHTPKARRSNGTEVIPSSSSKSPLPRASSHVLLFNHCPFPRSLTSGGKINTNASSKRQLPSLPTVQTSEEKHFRTEELYNLLDHQSPTDFTEKLDRLTLSHVIQHNHQEMIDLMPEEEEKKEEQKENIFPNFFHQPSTSAQEKLFYSTTNVYIDEPKNLSLYTMTLSTVQLSASILLPYSILNGRRPLLKCSDRTKFKQIHSKQSKSTCQVTAIESSSEIKELEQNDILLKMNDQSIWGFSTDLIVDMLQRSPGCSLTIVRLCQPFI